MAKVYPKAAGGRNVKRRKLAAGSQSDISASGHVRHVGRVRCFSEKIGLGKIRFSTGTSHAEVAVSAAELGGFAIGEVVSFEMSIDPAFGTPFAKALEAEDSTSWPAQARTQAARQQQKVPEKDSTSQVINIEDVDDAWRRVPRGGAEDEAFAVELELEEALAGGDELALRLVLDRARQMGLVSESFTEAEALLRQLAVTRSLSQAVEAGDSVQLRAALARARALGQGRLQGGLLESAESAMKRLEASERLATAVSGMEEATLRGALEEAEKAGVASSALEAAARVLARLTAIGNLAAALSQNEEGPLRLAIAAAEAVGVQGDTLEEAEAVLRRLVAERDLDVAIASCSETALQAALTAAVEVGLTGKALQASKAGVDTHILESTKNEEQRVQAALADLEVEKRKAVEVEDFELALQLKRQQDDLRRSRPKT